MKPFIYITTNLINNKKYIGQCSGSSKKSTHYIGSGVAIKKAIAKYGKSNFKREIIVQGDFSPALLNELEIHYIQLHNALNSEHYYNCHKGGKHKKSTKQRMMYGDGKIYQYDYLGNIIKITNTMLEMVENISISAFALHGYIRSNRICVELNCYFTNNVKNVIQRPQYSKQSIDVYDLDGNFLERYPSYLAFANYLNVPDSCLYFPLKKKRMYGYKYLLCYSNEKFILEDYYPLTLYELNPQGDLVKEWKACSISHLANKMCLPYNTVLNKIKKQSPDKYTKNVLVRNITEFIPRKPISHSPIFEYTSDNILLDVYHGIHDVIKKYSLKEQTIRSAISRNSKIQKTNTHFTKGIQLNQMTQR